MSKLWLSGLSGANLTKYENLEWILDDSPLIPTLFHFPFFWCCCCCFFKSENSRFNVVEINMRCLTKFHDTFSLSHFIYFNSILFYFSTLYTRIIHYDLFDILFTVFLAQNAKNILINLFLKNSFIIFLVQSFYIFRLNFFLSLISVYIQGASYFTQCLYTHVSFAH